MSKTKKLALGLFAGCLILVWGLGSFFYHRATHPVSEKYNSVILEIIPGMTLRQTASLLAERRLIRDSFSFHLLAYLQDKQSQIRIGEYELSASMTPVEILGKITSGKTVLHAVTIPEGYRITEIAALLAERGMADKEVFIQQTQDKGTLQAAGITADSLEGYLFPETYHFSKHTPEQKIVQTMLDTFKAQAETPALLNRAQELNLTLHQVVTLASLIEKETGVDEERTLISSVFHNRLKKKMRLQTDPTVIYAIANFDGNIRKKDLSIDSPYNTYKYAGLPPGPIASPGLHSIVAAVNPDDTPYLYFVSRKDGSHQFSTNLLDHNRAVQKYQLKTVRSVKN